MNRFFALAAATLIWAAIYLPGLGGPELKGEEPRRALPAVAMLDSGNWVVPYLSGHPYLSKPPLVNWLIAGSMAATGRRDELAARLPSVLAMLALALTITWTGGRWLTPEGGFTAAVFVLVSVAFIEKGRMAEIEADYVALTGIALAWWLSCWANKETGWRLWLLTGICLGFGLLTKGPTHLLLFYALVIPALFSAREQRQLASVAHLGSLAIAGAIFAVWWIPYHKMTTGLGAENVWLDQMKGRVGGGSLQLHDWLPNLPRALVNGLPWLLFAPLWWNRRVLDSIGEKSERIRGLLIAVRWPWVIAFAGIMLIPGMLPRYTLPILPAAALLLALVAPYLPGMALTAWKWVNRGLLAVVALAAVASPWIAKPAHMNFLLFLPPLLLAGFVWRFFRDQTPAVQPSRLVAWTAVAAAGGMAIFSAAAVPRMRLREELRPVGAAVNAAVPPNETLYVFDQEYEPALFYVKRACAFLRSTRQLPTSAACILVRPERLDEVKRARPAIAEIVRVQAKSKKEFFILKLSSESEKTPARSGS